MMKLDVLRRQQVAALGLAQELLDLIEAYEVGDAAYPLLLQLNRLFNVLRVHLVHMDVELYPRLMQSAEPRVEQVARLLADEMGDLAEQLEEFGRQWSCSASITSQFTEFRNAAHDLVLCLAVRIDRESHFLFPLAEAEAARAQPCDAA